MTDQIVDQLRSYASHPQGWAVVPTDLLHDAAGALTLRFADVFDAMWLERARAEVLMEALVAFLPLVGEEDRDRILSILTR